MISISAWFHIKKQRTQLSLKSAAETHSEPQKQWQYSVRVSPPISLYLWPSTNHSSLWTSGSTLSNEEFKNEWSQFWIQVTASWIIVTWVYQCTYPLGMIETMADVREHTHTRGMHYSCGPVRPELEVAVMADRERVWDVEVPLPSSWSP